MGRGGARQRAWLASVLAADRPGARVGVGPAPRSRLSCEIYDFDWGFDAMEGEFEEPVMDEKFWRVKKRISQFEE